MLKYLDECNISQLDGRLGVSLKGWAESEKYEISVIGDGKEIKRFSNNTNRRDVCKVLGQEEHDNTYGFEKNFFTDIYTHILEVWFIEGENKELLTKKEIQAVPGSFPHYVDEFQWLQIRYDRLKIHVRGWAGTEPYEIIIRSDGEDAYRFKNNQDRPDVCKVLNEEVHENRYGFDETFVIRSHVNVLSIWISGKGKKELIESRHLNLIPDEKKVREERKAFYEKNVKEHPHMSKDRKNRYLVEKKYGIPVLRVFDPQDPRDYNEWLNHQTYYYENSHFRNVTFITVGKNKVRYPFGYRHMNMETLDLSAIHTPYVCFVKDSCVLYPPFYDYLVKVPEYDLLYSDSDHINRFNHRCDPEFKPDYSPETLHSCNYIGNVFTVRTELLKDLDHTPIQLYRYLLELSEKEIHAGHISRVLYQDREYEKDTHEVLEQFFHDHHENVKLVDRKDGTMCETHYVPQTHPLISIIIPTRDHKEDLERCLNSIFAKTAYDNYEIVIVDNNSEEKETLEYFQAVQAAHANVHVHALAIPFNYSLINNTAVREYARGEYVVLLNNDTEVVSEHWLDEMLGYCERKKIGSVGVRLLYPDGTLQHAGILLGKGGVADHVYYRYDSTIAGYGCSLQTARNVIGCTAACVMVKRSVYLELGGFNEEIQVAFNDVDFMLRLWQKGWRNVYLPFVTLIHYESKSRGMDDSQQKYERFNREKEYMIHTWGKQLRHDPYYNDNFAGLGFYMLKCRRSFGPEEDPDCY